MLRSACPGADWQPRDHLSVPDQNVGTQFLPVDGQLESKSDRNCSLHSRCEHSLKTEVSLLNMRAKTQSSFGQIGRRMGRSRRARRLASALPMLAPTADGFD